MKKTSIILSMLALSFASQAQTRVSLYEEFTGENCPPCASTNPALDALLAQPTNTAKAQCIKWQVAIPSAPSNTWSLYQTNSAEINTRNSYYSNTSAPSGRMDGQNVSVFGASSNHPANLTSTHISNAQAITTPFSITMNTAWDGTFSNAVVTITVTSSGTFNAATNALRLRLVLTEKNISFATAPGTNGEKDFHWAVRKSYPNVTGTLLNQNWVAAGTQTFTINCAAPSYITDKGQMTFVAFIQDDSDKKVYQTARSSQPAIPNEAKATAIAVNSVMCASNVAPMVTVYNNGTNAITSLTILPTMNAVNGTPTVFACNIAPATSTVLQMGSESLTNGTNAYSFSITGVSGGDIVPANNGLSTTFYNSTSYAAAPVSEGFASATFPPVGFGVFNPSNAKWPWSRSTSAGGFGTSSQATYVFINWTSPNNTHELVLPGTSLTGTLFPSISFDLAYAQLDATGNDILQLQVSTNCGNTWTTAWQNQGATMATAPPNNSALFVPTATQWTAVTVPLYTYSNTPGVLVRFHAIGGTSAGKGNAIYVDNINLFNQSTTGLALLSNTANTFEVFPNPASTEVNVTINSVNAASSTINITNTLGQVVTSKAVSLNAGENTIQLDTKALPSGIYYISYGSGKGAVTKKLTITK